MKTILIILNILLAGAVVWGSVGFVKKLSPVQNKAGFTVKKRSPKAKKTAAVTRTDTPKTAILPPDVDALAKQIVEQDVFNPDRCPNGGFWGGGNARVEMTLVGTFKIGNAQGAVILQKSQTRNFPFMPFGGMMPPGGFQQRRQGISRSSGTGPQDNGMQPSRRQIGGARSFRANRGAQGVMQPGQQDNNNKPVTYKQYVRLGETMSNGYKLTEISRNRVVLTRGSDKLELELADPSVNAPKTVRRSRPANQTQIMQQMLQSMQNMQRAQMMQGFQMMRMNQRNMQADQQGQGSRGGMMPRRR